MSILKDLRLSLLVGLILLCISIASASGVGLKPPEYPRGTVPIVEPEYFGLSRFFSDSTIFESPFTRFKRTVSFDSLSGDVQIRELLYDKDYRLPVGIPLDYYVKKRLEAQHLKLLREKVLKSISQEKETGPGGIELNIPVRIRSKAFKRIFGGDRVGLHVTGNISFELAGRSEKREGSAVSSLEQKGTFSPRFKQTQQFQVEGKVGDKVSVKVEQNSEATFDLENTLKLTYTGDEDEIIQSIEAGNVSLSLPSTNYVSASQKHQGLFGLKTRMQIGNLSFTGVASLQRGEKSKITKTGKADENEISIKDYEYVRDRFFFVDSIYQANFEKGYNPQTMTWQVFGNGAYRITQLDVWVKAKSTDNIAKKGWAVVHPEQFDPNNLSNLTVIPGEVETAYFKRLEYPGDYQYDEYRGFFWVNQSVDEQDIVAVAYETEGGVKQGMLYTEIPDSTSDILLKLIKPQASKPEYPTWNLSMRNVYNLGASRIPAEGFDVKILFTKEGNDQDVQHVGEAKPYVFLMGLDRLSEQGTFIDGGDKKVDVNNGNIFDLSNGYLIFPSTTPFAPPENSNFKIDKSLYVNIYDIKDRTKELQENKFTIKVTTATVSSTYNLGFNVLENSEVVRLNGRELVKDRDYTIDYFSGTLQILAEEARRADANVEIEYEKGNLFQLDKKTLLGGRLEYSFGDRGFIGLTGLYLNKTTLDQRIRLGQEPLKNFIWDVNTALKFRPNFLTKALDLLPVVETSAESKFEIEAEYAQVNPNPNTFNEEKLGETKGVAYIDDFEGSERSTPLGVTYKTWSPASIPAHFYILDSNVDFLVPADNDELNYQMDRNRLRMFWYNPYNQVPIKDIWPNKDVNTQTGTTTNVLVLQWKNDEISPDSAWAGIMRSTISFPDQNKSKFIELWIKGEVGQVNVDIGRISEDFYIKEGTFTFDGKRSLRNLNTEDFNLNGLLDDGEDVGLDGVSTGNSADDDWDDWAPPQATNPAFLQINGFEGNGQAQGAKYPDTEDLDDSGGLDLTNEYFSYSFNLGDQSHPYIKGSTEKGWKLYRIPIRSFDPDLVVGQPDTNFREIFYTRLWINNLPQDGQYHTIQIATFDFVGNEWEEKGVALQDSTGFVRDDSLFSIAVYNTEENAEAIPGGPEPYVSPPNVEGVVDRITNTRSKEQSLVLQLGYLEPGARAEAVKQLYEKMNFINYKKLKMFVHGDRDLPDTDTPLEFYIRFGPTENIYYEVGGKVYRGWDNRNHIDVILDELAATKDRKYLTGDTLNNYPVYLRADPHNPEKYFKVVGEPSLRNINFILIGARNIGEFPLENREIWIDELRVTDVERRKGSAMRLMTNLTLADVATVRSQWEVVDSDFRHIEDQFGSGNTTEKQQYRFNVKVDKFMPSSWGFSIPVSGGYVKSKNIPKYFFNSDKLTNYRAESFSEKVEQFFGMNKLDPLIEENSRISETKSLGATLKRRSRGTTKSPWYLKYTVDMLQLDVDWSEKNASDERNLLNDSKSISGQLQLDVPFGRKNYFKPFAWLGNGPIVRKLANQQVGFAPTNMNAKISVKDNETIRQARLETNPTKTVTTTASRQFSMAYNLFPSMAFNFRRDYQSDANLKGYRASDLVNSIFTKFDFGVDKTMNQSFSANYNPKFVKWMTQSFKYTSNFNYNYSNVNTNEKSHRLQVSKKMTFNIKPTMLANAIYNPAKRKLLNKGKKNTPRAGGRGARRGKTPPSSPEEGTGGMQKDAKTGGDTGQPEESGRSPLAVASQLNPLKLVWHFFNAWKSVGINYDVSDNYNYYNIDRIPGWKHQLGFSSDPGVGTDTTFGKIPRLPAIKNSKRITANASFDIIRNLQTTFKYNYSKDDNKNNQQHTANKSSTYFFTGDDPEANKKSWAEFVPDWQLRLTGVENFFFFKKFAKAIQVEHARSGSYKESSRLGQDEVFSKDNWAYTNNFQPLLGISVNTNWGINGNIRYTASKNFSYTATGSANKSERSGLDVTFSFSKSGGFKIPLPFLSRKRLKNEMQFNFTFNMSNDVSYAKRAGSDKFEEQTKNSSIKLKPSLTYRFSQKVNGSTFFEWSTSDNKRTGKYSYFEFGINVNIAIR